MKKYMNGLESINSASNWQIMSVKSRAGPIVDILIKNISTCMCNLDHINRNEYYNKNYKNYLICAEKYQNQRC